MGGQRAASVARRILVDQRNKEALNGLMMDVWRCSRRTRLQFGARVPGEWTNHRVRCQDGYCPSAPHEAFSRGCVKILKQLLYRRSIQHVCSGSLNILNPVKLNQKQLQNGKNTQHSTMN